MTETSTGVATWDSDPLTCDFSPTGQHHLVCGGVVDGETGYWWFCDNGLCRYEEEGW